MHTIDEYLGMVECRIKELRYPASPKGLYEPIKYTLDGGGKRLRPVLTLAVCEAMGADPANALNQAMGVEMFHNFTLLHDDVMDHADMRRGRPTVHRRWDERTAILSGDAMLTMASVLVGENCPTDKYRKVNELFSRTSMEVYEGQQYDMDFEERADVTVEEYMEMIRLKTSVLLGCACGMGAIMGDADETCASAMYAYGEKLGLAFQLQDDYLDTYGDPIIFGKEIGGDILNDKKTWLLITALSEDESGVLMREIKAPSEPSDKIDAVRGVYDRLNLPARCHELIDRYVREAIAELEKASLPPAARDFFVALAENSRTRTH